MKKKKKKLEQALSDSKQGRFRQWKSGKWWIYGASVVTILAGGVVTTAITQPQLFSQLVHALDISSSDGSQVGTIGSTPVIKSTSNSMSSNAFKNIVSALVAGQNPSTVVNQVAWGASSGLAGGQNLSNFGTSPTYVYGQEGFQPTDQALLLNAGNTALIRNVGTAITMADGSTVPIDLGITFRSAQAPGGGTLNSDMLLSARNNNGVITLAWGAYIESGVDGGGEGENGGIPGGGDGSGFYFIDNVSYKITLLNHNTGQPLPRDTLMPIKVSDIDGSQRATMDQEGALGYIIGPDSVLRPDGDGFVSAPNESINGDSSTISAQSYVALKQYNDNLVQYQYTDGKNDHMDIVTGHFGGVSIPLDQMIAGYVQLDKTTAQFGDNLPNGHYDFTDLKFQVINKEGKVVDTLTLDGAGKSPKSKALPPGDYTLHEISDHWDKTGQTERPDVSVHVTGGKTTTISGDDLKNNAVQGSISISKKIDNFDGTLPNNLYDYTGIQYKVWSDDNKYSDIVTLDKDGKGTTTKKLPLGDYNVQENKDSVTVKSGLVYNDKIYIAKLTYKDQNTELVTSAQPVEDTAVHGQISITKKGVESGTDLWNGNYNLAGNVFKITSLTDGKTYEITTDTDGKAATSKDMPLGKYKVEEIKSSNGFGNTFKPVEVELTWKNNTTEIVYDAASGTNQEIKGQNTLEKSDKDTGTDQNGKAQLKGAQYEYFHNDNSTGSSPHKVGDPIRWNEAPNPKVLKGTKVTSSVINGNTVDWGENAVIQVSDNDYQAAIGNLSEGDYYSVEVNAPEGHVVDPTKHEFSIKKKDDQTLNIVTPNTKSGEQVIKARIRIQKNATTPINQNSSGVNGVEYTATPLNGTKADAVTFKTGVNPQTGDDGYAQQDLVYGDWVVKETKGVSGTNDTEPIYIHMSWDSAKDELTMTASHNANFSDPFSSRTFNTTDNSSTSNPNGENSVGDADSSTPTLPLSTLTFNDNPTDETPSIDVEKANNNLPNAGDGNFTDSVNNAGDDDHDTKDTFFGVQEGATTPIDFRITNNGTETLKNVTAVDKTTNGSVDVKSITWKYVAKGGDLKAGETVTLNSDGYFIKADKSILQFAPGDTLFGTGTLAALPDGELHGDDITVSGIGIRSGSKVGDDDKWYGKALSPSIDIEKANDKMPNAGTGNHKDKDNNVVFQNSNLYSNYWLVDLAWDFFRAIHFLE